MKYIITSGPMEIAIDQVRKIQNSSTGKLGAIFVEQLIATNHQEVVYIHTSGAMRPRDECTQIEINNHQQLLAALEAEITADSVVIHAMAVSDFTSAGTLLYDDLIDLIFTNKESITTKEDVKKLIDSNLQVVDKLTSASDQVVFLNRSIKIIDQIKKINPSVKLVGFKLLSAVSENELIAVAQATKTRTDCDYIVANIKEEVSTEKHHAYIIGGESIEEVFTKQQIAQKIIELVEEK